MLATSFFCSYKHSIMQSGFFVNIFLNLFIFCLQGSPNSKPLQMVRGFLGAELFRLEDIISNLNKKIDIIGDRVTKRPNQLARASLMAGMTSTFGDLQNTIELLNKKLDRRLQPEQADMVISNDPRKIRRSVDSLELNFVTRTSP